MDNIIQHTHSGIMWLAVAALILSVLVSLIKFIKKEEEVSTSWFRLFHAAKWLLYIQVILGVILLFISQRVVYGEGFMKSSELRFYGMEHPLMMLIAVGLVAIGLFRSKKKTNAVQKNKVVFIYFAIALLIIMFMIPWEAVLT